MTAEKAHRDMQWAWGSGFVDIRRRDFVINCCFFLGVRPALLALAIAYASVSEDKVLRQHQYFSNVFSKYSFAVGETLRGLLPSAGVINPSVSI